MKITRKIASRRLKRECIQCNEKFIKGDVYYLNRHVFSEDGKVHAYEHLECPKCKWKNENQMKRFKKFQQECDHPERFVVTSYSYIPREAVMQPDHDECLLCSQIF